MKTIIMIAGLMCAGKTTLAEIIAKIARSQGMLVEQLKFATPIYAMQELEYKLAGQAPVKNRGLMQALGDACRDNMGADYYENVMEAAINRTNANLIIIDDMRFTGELELAKKLGAIPVLVGAPHEARKRRGELLGTWSETKHNSEQTMPFDQFDIIIGNNGDLAALNHKALKLWAKLFPAEIVPPAPQTTPPPPHICAHIMVVDALLRKHYGVTIDDTCLEEDAASDVAINLRPYECVNSWAQAYDMCRIDDGEFIPKGALTEADEASILRQPMSELRVAQTILAQLGGNRFIVMTGAKDFLGGEDSLMFRLPRGSARDGINKVKITLDWTDTYNVDFLKCDFKKHESTTISSHTFVYADGLQRLFTEVTGLDTKL